MLKREVQQNYNGSMFPFPAIEQRRQPRRPFVFQTKVLMDDVGPCSVVSVNVSRHGLRLFSHRPLGIDRNYAVAIAVPNSPRRINAWCTVVYCNSTREGFHAGVRFLDMDVYSKACIEDLLTSHVAER